MVNTEKLKDAIKKSGLKKSHIARCLGISRAGLSNLINGRTEFRVSHVQVLIALLDLDTMQRDEIFFDPNVHEIHI